jgi:hypothetical protein
MTLWSCRYIEISEVNDRLCVVKIKLIFYIRHFIRANNSDGYVTVSLFLIHYHR